MKKIKKLLSLVLTSLMLLMLAPTAALAVEIAPIDNEIQRQTASNVEQDPDAQDELERDSETETPNTENPTTKSEENQKNTYFNYQGTDRNWLQGTISYWLKGGRIFFNKTTGTIVYGEQTITEANIPSVIAGVTVTSIGNDAFNNCYDLTSVTIPNSVTFIGDRAFMNCYNVTNVIIPNSVTSLGKDIFYCCEGLTSVIISNGVTSIEDGTFMLCYNLTNVTIPNSVTSIKDYTFSYCSSLTSITIPDSVTSLGDGVFFNCGSLTYVTIPNSVTSLGSWAFQDCDSLANITIPNSVISIGDGTFKNCNSLTSITIPDSVTSLGDGVFWDCDNLTSVTISNNVTSIGFETFSRCNNLANVTIPDSVTSIGDSAFDHCGKLTSITIPNSVTSIGKETFFCCSGLTDVTIPSSVTSIGDDAFLYCYNLTIYCYKNTYAHRYAQEKRIKFILLDESSPDDVSIESVVLTTDNVMYYLLTQDVEFEHNSTNVAIVSTDVDWNCIEPVRVFLIQDRDTYVELPATFTPGEVFVPDAPIYVIVTNAVADTLLDWKPTGLRITAPPMPPEDFSISLSLWSDEGCANRITSMTNTYGSFSWEQTGGNFDAVYLKAEYAGIKTGEAVLTAPEGFSFAPYELVTERNLSVWAGGTSAEVVPVYPIYSETQNAELIFTVKGSDEKLRIPVQKNADEGTVYYRDSFDKSGGLSMRPWEVKNLSFDGFAHPSTKYDHSLATLSVNLSAASYKQDGVVATLKNFGFSKIVPCNYNFGNDQISVNQNQVACSFATKKLISDGEIYILVVIVIRGTVENEWYSNFNIGNDAVHQGFSNGKKYVLSQLKDYINALQDQGLTANRTKMLVTGHSRAAAVADLLTLDLNENQEQYAEHDNIYTYTFATPNSLKNLSDNQNNNNIFNIMNCQDFVTHVPGTFYSPGVNRYVNYYGDKNYFPKYANFREHFQGLVTNRSAYKPEYKSYENNFAGIIAGFDNMNVTDWVNTYGPAIADLLLGKYATSNTAALGLWILKIAANQTVILGTEAAPGVVVTEDAAVAAALMYMQPRIWSNHAIETYVCWLQTISDGYDYSNPSGTACVKIMCPVDVTVYDENKTVVSQIVNNEVVLSNGSYCGVEGDEKIFYLANSDYTFEITGYDDGNMNLAITEYNEDNQKTQFISYEDIPVVKNQTSVLTAKNCGRSDSTYTLITDKEEQQPDYVSSGNEIDALSVSIEIEGGGTALGSGQYSAGERVTLYAMPANGYHFEEWQTVSGGVSVSSNRFTMPEDNVIVKAVFEKNEKPLEPEPIHSYTITFHANGGVLSDSATITANENGKFASLPMPTREGYTFNGWFMAASGGEQITTDTIFDANSTVYAHWTQNSVPVNPISAYIIAFDTNGGMLSGSATITTDINGKLASLPSATRSGYTFKGWYTEKEGGEQITTDHIFTANTTIYAQWSFNGSGSFGGSSSGSGSSSGGNHNPPSNNITPETPVAISFTDIQPGTYYYDAVVWAIGQGVTIGTTAETFSPENSCTRAQMVTFLWRAAGSPAPQGGENPFTDVKSGAYYYDAVQWAVEQGITTGATATTFNPEATVTRGQTVTFLYRAAGSPATNGDSPFNDLDANAYYTDAVQWAVSKGVTTGITAATFSPNDLCTRGQIVTFLYRDRIEKNNP